MDKVSIFVDVQNIYYTTKQVYKKHFDYNAFWKKVTSNRKVIKAIAYGIDRSDEKQKQFQNILRGIGFELKLKPYIQRSDGSAKGDWDVGITIDVLDVAPKVDEVVLLSGDGDFAILLDKLRSLGVKTRVISAPHLTAASLIKACDHYQEISADLLL